MLDLAQNTNTDAAGMCPPHTRARGDAKTHACVRAWKVGVSMNASSAARSCDGAAMSKEPGTHSGAATLCGAAAHLHGSHSRARGAAIPGAAPHVRAVRGRLESRAAASGDHRDGHWPGERSYARRYYAVIHGAPIRVRIFNGIMF